VILLAAVCSGIAAYAAAGIAMGRPLRVARRATPKPSVSRHERWLAQAGVPSTPLAFWAVSVGLGVAAFLVVAVVTGAPLVALVPAVAVGCVPRSYFGRRRAGRLRAVQGAWPDALRDVGASLASGRSLSGAVGELAVTGPDALRDAFARFASTARLVGVGPALELVKESLADPTSDRVLEVLVMASERGGAIVQQIVDDLVVTTTKDLKVLDEIETEGLEMKINARAVLVLPWLVLVALTVRGGAFRDFYRSSAGLLVIVVGAAFSAIGYVWITRLGRSLEEERVFGGARVGAGAAS